MDQNSFIIQNDDLILITGANGFVGSQVVKSLLSYGFNRLRCFVRPSSNTETLQKVCDNADESAVIQTIRGNLLSRDDCEKAVAGAKVILHLAAGVDKSFPAAFMNSVVATRNLLDAVVNEKTIKRFLNVSSFAIYSNYNMKRGSLLDETCEIDLKPQLRDEAYTYGKLKQDQLVLDYHRKYKLPYVIVRPSVVYGPGKQFIPSRIGINTFGFFMHIGGRIQLPLTYVNNCAEVILLAGLREGVDGEVFNIVDDDLPTSRQFLRLYKKNVRKFWSLYIPYHAFYFLSFLWEKYSDWSGGQLPKLFNRRRCCIYWKGNRYSNEKIKKMLGWSQAVKFEDALEQYFSYQKDGEK